jgi:hypothetical protein
MRGGEGESPASPGSSPAASHIHIHDQNLDWPSLAAVGEAVDLSFAGSPVSEGPSPQHEQAVEEGEVPHGADMIPARAGDGTARRGAGHGGATVFQR